jgi:hypothetical protein
MANFCAPPGVPLGEKTGYFHEGGAGGPDSIGRMQITVGEDKDVGLAFYIWSGKEVWVRSRDDRVARIIKAAVFNQDEKIYTVKACDRPDHTYLEAGQGERAWFKLEVQVTEKGSAMPITDPRLTAGLVVSGPVATVFTEGFVEGLLKAKRANTATVVAAIKGNPVNFYTGYIDGIAVGLWDGLVDLIKGLASLVELGAKFAPYMTAAANPIGAAALAGWVAYKWNFDPKFQEEIKKNAQWAKSVGEAASAVVTELKKNPKDTVEKYLGATREAGVQVGSALAEELDAKVPTASAFDFGYWAGWIIGRVVFEIIIIFVTEGIGEALKGASVAGKVSEGMKAAGATAEIVAKVRARLQGILEKLPALKAFVETLTKTKSAATAAEMAAKAKAIEEALQAVVRAKKALEAAEAFSKTGGAVEAAEAAAKARDAIAAWEAASKAGTSAEAQQLAAKAKEAADAAEQAVAKAKSAAEAAAKASRPAVPSVTSANMNIARETAGTGGIKAISGNRALDGSQKIAVEGKVLKSIARQNFEANLVSGSDLGLPTYERLHLWGPRLGDEAAAGIWLGPGKVNISEQARVEKLLQDLATQAEKTGGSVQLRVTGATHPPGTLPSKFRAHEFLSEITYEFKVEGQGTKPLAGRIKIDIGPPPNGSVQTLGADVLDSMLKAR